MLQPCTARARLKYLNIQRKWTKFINYIKNTVWKSFLVTSFTFNKVTIYQKLWISNFGEFLSEPNVFKVAVHTAAAAAPATSIQHVLKRKCVSTRASPRWAIGIVFIVFENRRYFISVVKKKNVNVKNVKNVKKNHLFIWINMGRTW